MSEAGKGHRAALRDVAWPSPNQTEVRVGWARGDSRQYLTLNPRGGHQSGGSLRGLTSREQEKEGPGGLNQARSHQETRDEAVTLTSGIGPESDTADSHFLCSSAGRHHGGDQRRHE